MTILKSNRKYENYKSHLQGVIRELFPNPNSDVNKVLFQLVEDLIDDVEIFYSNKPKSGVEKKKLIIDLLKNHIDEGIIDNAIEFILKKKIFKKYPLITSIINMIKRRAQNKKIESTLKKI